MERRYPKPIAAPIFRRLMARPFLSFVMHECIASPIIMTLVAIRCGLPLRLQASVRMRLRLQQHVSIDRTVGQAVFPCFPSKRFCFETVIRRKVIKEDFLTRNPCIQPAREVLAFFESLSCAEPSPRW